MASEYLKKNTHELTNDKNNCTNIYDANNNIVMEGNLKKYGDFDKLGVAWADENTIPRAAIFLGLNIIIISDINNITSIASIICGKSNNVLSDNIIFMYRVNNNHFELIKYKEADNIILDKTSLDNHFGDKNKDKFVNPGTIEQNIINMFYGK
jgi:hypothetical protein